MTYFSQFIAKSPLKSFSRRGFARTEVLKHGVHFFCYLYHVFNTSEFHLSLSLHSGLPSLWQFFLSRSRPHPLNWILPLPFTFPTWAPSQTGMIVVRNISVFVSSQILKVTFAFHACLTFQLKDLSLLLCIMKRKNNKLLWTAMYAPEHLKQRKTFASLSSNYRWTAEA